MKKDVTIHFKDNEMLRVVGVSAENGISEMSTNNWVVCADMYENVYMINVETIKYITVKPHEEAREHAEKHD